MRRFSRVGDACDAFCGEERRGGRRRTSLRNGASISGIRLAPKQNDVPISVRMSHHGWSPQSRCVPRTGTVCARARARGRTTARSTFPAVLRFQDLSRWRACVDAPRRGDFVFGRLREVFVATTRWRGGRNPVPTRHRRPPFRDRHLVVATVMGFASLVFSMVATASTAGASPWSSAPAPTASRAVTCTSSLASRRPRRRPKSSRRIKRPRSSGTLM